MFKSSTTIRSATGNQKVNKELEIIVTEKNGEIQMLDRSNNNNN